MTTTLTNMLLYVIFMLACSFLTHSLHNNSTLSCLPHQSFALLHFKHEFSIKKPNFTGSYIPIPTEQGNNCFPKTNSWKDGKDCCDWEGVICDFKTGYVIDLDLSNTCLSGHFFPNSSLFNLTHLQRLNLAFNNFSSSQIPSTFGRLSRLTHLNLSYSLFSGEIPSQILGLANLVSLDLSSLFDLLRLTDLPKGLKNLEVVNLDGVNLSPLQPQSFASLSSLTSLSLSDCSLRGEFPQSIFNLPQIQFIDLSENGELKGSLPTFHSANKLKFLSLYGCNFYGGIPSSIGNLSLLTELVLSGNNFDGQIPSTIGDLSRLQRLIILKSKFDGEIPSSIGNLSQLTQLSLHGNFFGQIPLANLSKLESLDLNNYNPGQFPNSWELPTSLGNLSLLSKLSIRGYLSGQIPSTLGNLAKLESLDLMCDIGGFCSSWKLPISLGNLSQLSKLTLKGYFTGQIPNTLGNLAKLESLDVTYNPGRFSNSLELPSSLGNLSQLAKLTLDGYFKGQIPDTLGSLEKLESLHLANRYFGWLTNSWELPSWLGNLSRLSELSLLGDFRGELPQTLGNLRKLEYLNVQCDGRVDGLTGELPSSLGNLEKLKSLTIRGNKLSSQIPSSFRNLSSLISLDLSSNGLSGTFPSYLISVPSLVDLSLSSNKLSGPLSILNISVSQLIIMDLKENKLSGQIPSTISKLKNLDYVSLGSNNFSDTVDFNIFSGLSELYSLDLSGNNLTVLQTDSNLTFPKFTDLYLSSCNIHKFLDFLRTQDELRSLDLSNNKLEGKIPKWFLNIGVQTFSYMNISHNSITGWEESPLTLTWKYLETLDLHSNMLNGPLAIPPIYLRYLFMSENKLVGTLPQSFCSLTSLEVLDVSTNNLSGKIPQCLGFSTNLVVLSLQGNNFSGTIPHTFLKGSQLRTIDLSYNQLQGKVPQSLINCTTLEVLNLGNNQINDGFPFWLHNLPELQILVLRSNKFHGPIWDSQNFSGFKKLRIMDLSFNVFTGAIRSDYFKNWSSMSEVSDDPNVHYVGENIYKYEASMTVVIKGMEMKLVRILTIFTSIDLSNNKFFGEIPISIVDLQGLIGLNLSRNNFEGLISPSFGKLSEIESLDLSNNKLSGRIPQELASLNFLQFLNLSRNQLTGQIPEGRHFDTFSNSSFAGNSGLCGFPLSKKCHDVTHEKPLDPESHDSESEIEFGWKAVVIGYGCGFLVGAIGGFILWAKKPSLFIKIYGREKRR